MQRNLDVWTRFCLLTGGFLTALLFYFFFATFQIVSFRPPAVPTELLPQWVPWYRPEIDLQLYLNGVLVTIVLGLGIFFLLSRLIPGRMNQQTDISAQAYLRGIAVYDLVLYTVIVTDWSWWSVQYPLIAALSLSVLAGLIWATILNRKTTARVAIIKIFDLAAAAVIIFVSAKILYGIAFLGLMQKGPVFEYLRANDYWAFPGFGISETVVTGLILLPVIRIWLRPPGLRSNIRNILYPLIDLSVVWAILWLVGATAMIRPDDDIELARHNMSTFMGPVADVLAGKTMFVDVPSQYGQLMIYMLAGILQFMPRLFTSFVWINYWFGVIGLILLYIAARRWIGWGAIVFIILYFEHFYFSGITNVLWNTSQGFVRFGWWILVFVFLVIRDRLPLHPKITYVTELLLVSLGIFWGFETGIYSLMAYIGYRGYLILSGISGIRKRVLSLFRSGSEIAVSIFLTAAVISVFTFLRSGQWPDWSQFGFFASVYQSGFYVFPMQVVGPYILVLAVYGIATLILLTKIIDVRVVDNKNTQRDYALAAYMVSLGLAQFIYFTGHSHSNGNLHAVSLPAFLLSVWLLLKVPGFYTSLHTLHKPLWSPVLFWSGIAGLGLFVVLSTTIGSVTALRVLSNRLDLTYPWLDHSYREQDLAESASAVNNYLSDRAGSNRRIAIVSTDVHYYIFKTRSSNMLGYNNNWTLFNTDQTNTLSRELTELKPEVIFVDDLYHPNNELIFSPVRNSYILQERYGMLNKWVRK